MSDKRSASVFGNIFEKLALARDPVTRKEFASEIWDEVAVLDFHPSEMGCNAHLEALGLARRSERDDEWEYAGIDY